MGETKQSGNGVREHRFLRILSLTVLGALLGCLAFYPVRLPILSLVAIAILLHTLERPSVTEAVVLGFAYGFVYAAGTMYWMHGIFGTLVIGLFALNGAYFALLGLLIHMTPRWRPVLRALLVALFAVGIEWLRGDAWYLRFPWYTVPHALAGMPAWIAPARWLGCYGLSLVIWFIVAWGTYWRFEIWLALLLLPFSAWLLPAIDQAKHKALLIQTENAAETEALFDDLPNEAMDLVVLPEYAYRQAPATALLSSRGPRGLARKTSAPVVFGAVEELPERNSFLNLAVLVGPDGQQLGAFPKQHPVPLLHDGIPGETCPVFPLEQGTLGIAICYDCDGPAVAGSLCEQGATVLIVPIHDGFGAPVRNMHHETMLRLRAVENDRWVLRAANSGRSEAISPLGIPSEEGVAISEIGHVVVQYSHRDTRAFGTYAHRLGPVAGFTVALALVVAVCRIGRQLWRRTRTWRSAEGTPE
jgi:apolipoprotein N-acyltransferase